MSHPPAGATTPPEGSVLRDLVRDPLRVATLPLVRSLRATAAALVPGGRDRLTLAVLVALGALIPVTELFVTKIFTDVVTRERRGTGLADVAGELVAFFVLFLGTRVAHYAQRVQRVRFFDRVFRSSGRDGTGVRAGWEWAVGLELVNVLSFATQLVVVAGFFVWLAPVYGAFNVLLVAVLLEVVARLFRGQLTTQARYVESRRRRVLVPAYDKLRTRVVSAELGTLISSVGVVVLLGALIVMSVDGLVDVSTTVVLFLGARLQNGIVASLSGAVMRYARAVANAELRADDDEDEDG